MDRSGSIHKITYATYYVYILFTFLGVNASDKNEEDENT